MGQRLLLVAGALLFLTSFKTFAAPARSRLATNVPFRSIILRWSESRRLDGCLVAGLIKQESNFRSDAVGFDGLSFGLMQLRPSTAAMFDGVATRERLLLDVDFNVQMGTAFLEWLRDNQNIPLPSGVSAYNTGAAGFRRGFTPIPPDYTQRVIRFSKELCA